MPRSPFSQLGKVQLGFVAHLSQQSLSLCLSVFLVHSFFCLSSFFLHAFCLTESEKERKRVSLMTLHVVMLGNPDQMNTEAGFLFLKKNLASVTVIITRVRFVFKSKAS